MANPMNLDDVWFRNDTANINGMRSKGNDYKIICIPFCSVPQSVSCTARRLTLDLHWPETRSRGLEYGHVNQTNLGLVYFQIFLQNRNSSTFVCI